MISPNFHLRSPRLSAWVMLGLLSPLTFVGCQQWPRTAQFQQAQMDNERLLSELRSHKKRADELQAKNEQLAQRLDESERLLARTQSNRPTNRLSSAENGSGKFSLPTTSADAGLPYGPKGGTGLQDPKSLDPSFGRPAPRVLDNSGSSRNISPEAPKWRPARKNP